MKKLTSCFSIVDLCLREISHLRYFQMYYRTTNIFTSMKALHKRKKKKKLNILKIVKISTYLHIIREEEKRTNYVVNRKKRT